ncbi:ATP-binding protein [Nannocystaceae bacterium ST9]
MAEFDDLSAQAVANLVTQFSSALDFYRELVQNSIDAGSSTIEIWLDYTPDEAGGSGVIEIHVDDFGEGMTSEIIDDQLTTLFASSKEGDLTKIGKFGIGFVSVFAIQPAGVLVQTGRDGEYWEVFFHADRTFSKSPLATPVEGTQITLFVAGDRARYTELVARSRETIDHWCRHSEAEIGFEDRASRSGERASINKPFAVEGECPVEVEHEGTKIVLAFSHQPVWGFYNKGLALAVVRGESDLIRDRHRHVAFRIKSRYLEHTLSRETVVRDGNYDKAMALIDAAIAGPLRAALIAAIVELVTLAGARRWTARERARYFVLMDFLAREGGGALEPWADRPLWLGLDSSGLTLDRLFAHAIDEGHEQILVDDQRSPLIERVLATSIPVVLVPALGEPIPGVERGGNPVARALVQAIAFRLRQRSLLSRTFDRLVRDVAPQADARALALIVRPSEVLVGVGEIEREGKPAALVADAERLLLAELAAPGKRRLFARSQALGYRKLVCAELLGDAGPLFVVGPQIAALMTRPGRERDDPQRAREAVVNREHPHFRALLILAEREPELAAYCLARSLLLDRDRGLEFDTPLMEAASELRQPLADA